MIELLKFFGFVAGGAIAGAVVMGIIFLIAAGILYLQTTYSIPAPFLFVSLLGGAMGMCTYIIVRMD